ncbi:adenosylcobinamide amidohydrolase [Paenibacillus chartarius]|uniref:Adenosylcobinamide amidohydrolase n=1 Tax=Paenibacillus chartarius TaxID=747481 RepID=A0ABV6DEU9_9BACL
MDEPYPYLLAVSDEPLRTLNTAPFGGGFGQCRLLVNRQVGITYDHADPNAEMEAFLRRQRLEPEATACLMTAARVGDAAVASAVCGAARVTSLVTVGLGNKARAGLALPAPQLYPGTINTIVLVGGAMTDAAMAGAVLTATEAKAAALQALDERVAAPSCAPEVPAAYATGTTTDAVLIAAVGHGPLHRYAGTATEVGYLIGRTVYDAVVESGRRYQAYRAAKA